MELVQKEELGFVGKIVKIFMLFIVWLLVLVLFVNVSFIVVEKFEVLILKFIGVSFFKGMQLLLYVQVRVSNVKSYEGGRVNDMKLVVNFKRFS